MFDALRRSRRAAAGQTVTELLMILGIITAVALIVLTRMHVGMRGVLRTLVNCIVNDFDRCMR